MKRIGLTQRVEVLPDRNERRDCLDQNWARLLFGLGMMPLPLANKVENPDNYLRALRLDGVILTGGNDLKEIEGGNNTAPERDRFEHFLLDFCGLLRLPVLGVCRGVQIIHVYCGGRITTINDHVSCRHPVTLAAGIFDEWPAMMQVTVFTN